MIITYYEYIKESFLNKEKIKFKELFDFLKEFFNDKYDVLTIIDNRLTNHSNEIALIEKNKNNFKRQILIFNYFNNSYKIFNKIIDKLSYECETLESLKNFLNDYINNRFYTEMYLNIKVKLVKTFHYKNTNKISIIDLSMVPVFNKEKYNEFIMKLVKLDNEYLNQYNKIAKNLTDENNNKLEMLYHAKKFDLI